MRVSLDASPGHIDRGTWGHMERAIMAREKNKLTDQAIKKLVAGGNEFEVSDGDGLWLRMREGAEPVFRFRYRYAGKARVLVIGRYGEVSLKQARDAVSSHRGRLSQKFDIAKEVRDRQAESRAADAAKAGENTVGALLDEYWVKRIVKRKLKHPERLKALFDKDIRGNIGHLPVNGVKLADVENMLKTVLDRQAPTVANDVLRWTRKIFDYAIARDRAAYNPAATLTQEDAGGKEKARKRNLSRPELVKFFAAMRKTELTAAPLSEFDLDAAEWKIPEERSKTHAPIDIPLSKPAVASLRELKRLAEPSKYLLPARKAQKNELPHIHENTLNVALSKIRQHMPGVPHFHVHDLRRTVRTSLAALGVSRHIAERCLNHVIPGVEGTYDAHEYFNERRDALKLWSELLDACEAGQEEMTKWWAAFEKRKAAKA